MKKIDLSQGNIYKVLLLFALPLMLGSLIQQLYVTVDAAIVGQCIGKNGLAAIDSVHTLFRFPINFMNGMSAGVTILISKYFGARDKDGVVNSIRTACLISVVLGVMVSLLGVAFTPSFLRALSVPETIYGKADTYTRIYFAGMVTMILYNMFAAILRAVGDTRRPLYVLAACAVFNIIGDYIMIVRMGMGVAGAALATVIAQGISAFIVIYIVIKEIWLDASPQKTYLKVDLHCLWHMLKIGMPLAIQSMLFPIANTIVQASVNTLGTNEIAAWGLCDKADMLIWLIADSMGPALTTYVAQNIGAGKMDRVKRGVRSGTLLSVLGVGLVSLTLYIGMDVIGTWFLTPKDAVIVVPLATGYMKIMAGFFIFYAVGEALSGACCSMGNTVIPMVVTMVSMCMLRMLAIWFVFPNFLSMECVVWIYIASWMASAISFFIMYEIRLHQPFSCTLADTSLQ